MSKQGVGYTPKQAQRLKQKIDREVAKIEDALAALRQAVPDTTASNFAPGAGGIDGIAEEVRAIGHGLNDVIDRRTEGPRR